MTKGEIENQIQKELKHIECVKTDIENCKYDIKATRRAIAFWRKELKKLTK